mgnify:CR=1 FL=1
MAVNIKTILACLDSPEPKIRVRAIIMLVRSGDKRAIPFLEKSASDDTSPQVRYYARKGIAYIMQKSGDAKSDAAKKKGDTSTGADSSLLSPGEIQKNLDSPEQWTRLQTIRAIEQYEASEYIPLLISRLAKEENRQVLSAMLMAVGKIGGEEGIEAILPFLKNEDARVRANAIEAIDATGDHDSLVHLIPFLRDPDNRCRANAVIALKKYGRVNVFKTLEGMLKAKEVWMQDSATYVLGRMGAGNKTFDLLQLALKSEYLVVRKQAKKVLSDMADRGIERAVSLLERVGSQEKGNAEEQLFIRLEELSQRGSIKSMGDEDEGVSDSPAPSDGPKGKSPDEVFAALSSLSSRESKDTEDSSKGPRNPQEQLERRAQEAFLALQALSTSTAKSKKGKDRLSKERANGKQAFDEETKVSGAFEAIKLGD